MFACRRDDLLELSARSRIVPPGGYKLLLGLLAIVPAARVRHLTVPFLARSGGDSKLGVRIVITTLRQLYALWHSHGFAVRRLPETPRNSPGCVANQNSLK